MKNKIITLALSAVLFALCVVRPRAAAEESPSDRLSIKYSIEPVSPPVPREFASLCVSEAT